MNRFTAKKKTEKEECSVHDRRVYRCSFLLPPGEVAWDNDCRVTPSSDGFTGVVRGVRAGHGEKAILTIYYI